MSRLGLKAWMVALVAALAGAAPAETAHLVGADKALWLIISQDKSYRLGVRYADGPWTQLPMEAQGAVAAVTGLRDSAVIFFDSGRSVRYFPAEQDEQHGVKPGESIWPPGTQVLAACPSAADDAHALVLVRRLSRATAATQTAATTAVSRAAGPGVVELALLGFDGQQWRQLTVVPEQLTGSPQRAWVAAAGAAVYVLLDGPARALLVLAQDGWKPLRLPAELASGTVLGLMARKQRLVLAGFNLGGPGQVGVARCTAGKWEQPQILSAEGKPLTWPRDNPPAVALSGEAVALGWQEKGKWLVAEFDLQRQRISQPQDVFARAGAARSARKIGDYFLGGVLLLLVLLMFWPGQALRTAAFSLPPALRPGGLPRRLAAFAIDLLPFLGAGYYLAGGSDPEAMLQSVKLGLVQVEAVYASLAFLVGYLAYCILLEHLLGATFGKMAMRLRVIGDSGKRPTLREIALRNVSKIPEILTVLLLLFPLFTRYRQRLGDKIAWTAVVDMGLSLPPQDDSRQPPAGSSREDQDEAGP